MCKRSEQDQRFSGLGQRYPAGKHVFGPLCNYRKASSKVFLRQPYQQRNYSEKAQKLTGRKKAMGKHSTNMESLFQTPKLAR